MGMSATAQGKRGRAAPEMNVTPLVDVVLVLLIIFMVVTPLMAKQFWVSLPSPPKTDEEQAVPGEGPIVITVTEQGELRINREVIPRDKFGPMLTRVLAAKGDRTVFFDAHDHAPFGAAAQALDLSRGAGATTIAIAPDPIVQD